MKRISVITKRRRRADTHRLLRSDVVVALRLHPAPHLGYVTAWHAHAHTHTRKQRGRTATAAPSQSDRGGRRNDNRRTDR